MKYGIIKWKVEKVVFKIDGGIVKRRFEVDEGRTTLKKASEHGECFIGHESTAGRSA